MAVQPILAEAVGVSNVRFFAPPPGRGNFPWVTVDDLFQAMALPRRARLGFKKDLRSDPDWKKALLCIDTASGPVEMMPNWAAMGFLTAMREQGHIPMSVLTSYTAASVKGVDLLASAHQADPQEFFKAGLAHDFKESRPDKAT